MPEEFWDVMCDLETMSSSPNAAIVAIGAVKFKLAGNPAVEPDLTTPTYEKQLTTVYSTKDHFYVTVSLQSSIDDGLQVSGSTVEWWLQQSQEARDAILRKGQDLPNALANLSWWFYNESKDPEERKAIRNHTRIWAHATFDLPILHTAYGAVRQQQIPWKYTLCRDVRTIYDLAYPGEYIPGLPDTMKHHALYDAWRQALGVQIAYRTLTDHALRPTRWVGPATEFRRASGDLHCSCSKRYSEHEQVEVFATDHLLLNRLCDGSYVKL